MNLPAFKTRALDAPFLYWPDVERIGDFGRLYDGATGISWPLLITCWAAVNMIGYVEFLTGYRPPLHQSVPLGFVIVLYVCSHTSTEL